MNNRLTFNVLITASIINFSYSTSTAYSSVNFSSEKHNEYTITIDKKTPLKAHILARIYIQGDTLEMNSNCPNYDYPEGWASFVEDVKIKSLKGKSISYNYVAKSKWIIKSNKENVLLLDYTVDLSFTKIKWDVGNEQSGFTDNNSTYLVTKALFIYDANLDKSSEVTFNFSPEWQLAVAWNPKNSAENTFYVPDRESLIENSLVYGNFTRKKFSEGAFQFTIALLGEAKNDVELITSVLLKITKAYMRIFEKTPLTNYLLTMFYADLDDGESFKTSLAFTLKNRINENSKIIWANQMSHELFHYWNSDLLVAENYSERQWFSEGSAEYYANLTLVREGIISESVFENKIEKVLGLYQNYRGWRESKISLLEAGKKKGLHRFLVYNGGWATAMALDVLIMEQTNAQKNLDDFFKLMFDKYVSTSYTYEDIIETASEVCGCDLSEFFAKYVSVVDLIPLDEFLTKLGYSMEDIIYEAEIYLTKMPKNLSSLNEAWLRK